jgi:NADH-quinone oxidoreductase subunit M
MGWFDSWILTLAIFLPLVGAALIVALPKRYELATKVVGVATSSAVLVLGIALLAAFDYSDPGGQFAVNVTWIEIINSNYHVFVDGLSLPLLVMSMLISLLCVIYSWNNLPAPANPKAFFALLLLLEAGINGAFLAQDLVLFFVFFEVVLVPMYFMVGIWGGKRRQYAALKFFVYTVFGSALMLVSFLGIYFLGGQTFDIPQLASGTTELDNLTETAKLLLFGALFFGLAVKIPVFPFHTWMPDAHTEAPTAASVLLAAVLLKLGAYGVIRIAVPVLPDAAVTFAPWIGLLAVIGIIYGALGCFAQLDMKRLVAFSSLSHMGFVMLAISTLTPLGMNAAVFAMVAHGLITGMLFFLSGSIQQRLATRELTHLGGLLSVAPRLTWILGFSAVASLGLPGLAGFWGEFGSILAAFQPAEVLPLTTFRVYMVLGAVGTVLGAAYLLWMYQRIAFGPPSDVVKGVEVHDATKSEYAAWAPLIILIAVLGVFPSLLFGITDPTVTELVRVLG